MTRSASSSKDLKFPWPFISSKIRCCSNLTCPLWLCLTSCAMALLTSTLSLFCVLSSSWISRHTAKIFCLHFLLASFHQHPWLLLCEALASPSMPEPGSAPSAAIFPLQSCIFFLASSVTLFAGTWKVVGAVVLIL